ncbi:MAG: hypothetical protein K0B08_12535 [Bacteroidales bacterium]|nr:hypothetical protein [Bacteroidales bacterium]
MKKIALLIVSIFLVIAGTLSSNAQVAYHVTFSWDDSNCSCNDPVTKEARIYIYTYPGGQLVDDTSWFSISSTPHTHDDEATGLSDCDDPNPCYTVYVIIRYIDNTGVCCSGSGGQNTTGALLMSGNFSLSNTIILN